MTPNDIQVLTHLYKIQHPQNDLEGRTTIDRLVKMNLIKPDTEELTPKGKVMVKMLCNTPLPKRDWVDPR